MSARNSSNRARSHKRLPFLLGLTASAIALAVVVLPQAADASQSNRDAVSQNGIRGFRVVGNTLERGGQPFIARGLNSVAAEGWAACGNAQGNLAARNFDSAELSAVKSQWHANIIRFLVPQPSLAMKDGALLKKIEAGVAFAETFHLGVILAMQAETWSCGDGQMMPTNQTVKAWQFLAPAFANDRNVMFELFNEPRVQTTAKGWAQWLNGCSDKASCQLGTSSVGMQTLLNVVRATGANNALLADGPAWAESFHGITGTNPSTGQNYFLQDVPSGLGIVYAEHPYTTYVQSPSVWQHNFGFLASAAPVMVTEWNFKQLGCFPDRAKKFFNFVKPRTVGLVAFAVDASGTTTVRKGSPSDPNHWQQWKPTNCESSHLGSGLDTLRYFASFHRPS